MNKDRFASILGEESGVVYEVDESSLIWNRTPPVGEMVLFHRDRGARARWQQLECSLNEVGIQGVGQERDSQVPVGILLIRPVLRTLVLIGNTIL